MAEFLSNSLYSDANCKAYYRVESGALTTDSKSSYTLTNTGTVAEIASGKFGYAADFGSGNTSKYLQLNGNNMGITSGSITMMCWIKTNYADISSGQWSLLHHTDAGSKVHYDIGYQYNGGTRRVIFDRSKRTVADDFVAYNIALDTSLWYHLAVVYNGTTLYGYFNGANIGNTASSGTGSGTYSVTGMFIGSEVNNGDTVVDFYSGFMDDIVIFDRALSDAEILSIYQDQLSHGYYHMSV